jgi:Peptidase family M50.
MSIIHYFNEPFESYITYIAGRMQMTYAEGFLCAIAFIVAILSALVLHEIAHGYIAYKNGDDTAKVMGRLTLNPVSHLDPIGTLCMLLVGFGWAKPVPVNPNNIQTRKGMLGVSVAGVITNLILSFLLFGIYYLIIAFGLCFAKYFAAILNTLFRFIFIELYCLFWSIFKFDVLFV